MSEKVIFEFRARHETDGYHYEVHSDEPHFQNTGSPNFSPFCGMPPFAHLTHCAPWAKGHRRFRKFKGKAGKRMHQALDSLEQIYQDLYKPEERPV